MNVHLRGFFVCNACHANCHDGCDEIGVFGPNSCPGAYHPRKQTIKCLGPYCDEPCELREDTTDLTPQQLIDLVIWLGEELNKHIMEPQ